ncbi:MAG: HlyD family efflux transporter periplasmic adaptor subunit [Chitinispirillaceae bacterium]|nr:HlyD family efflux transporter periplasmic adaptor subunit [Chitinispirillaceae bacterium]
MPSRKKWIHGMYIGVGAVIVIIIAVIAGRGGATSVQYMVATERDVLETVLASGRIAGSSVVPLSFQKGGTVARIPVKEGESIEIGDTIMMLDNLEEKNAVAQRRIAVRAARIALSKVATTDASQAEEQLAQAVSKTDLLKKQLERYTALSSTGAAPAQELDRVRHDYEVAVSQQKAARAAVDAVKGNQKQLLEVQLAQAQAALDEAVISLSRTCLRAYEPGRVVKIKVNEGELVSPAAAVAMFLPRDTTTHVELLIDEDEVYRIKAGQQVLLRLASLPDSTFDARVREIVPVIDASRGTATVKCSIDGGSSVFIPDQTVSAQIIIGTIPSGIALEKRFVAQKNGRSFVSVLSNGRSQLREVTARDIGSALLLISEGLEDRDTVLFGLSLKNNAKVVLEKSD